MGEISINLNGFKLRDNTISKMKELLQDTKRDKLERGFDLCSNVITKELLARNICTGSCADLSAIKRGGLLTGLYQNV